MSRFSVFIAILASALALGQAAKPAPVIHFSVYAPPQVDPPVHIVGFEHDRSELRFVLSNTSERSVDAVVIAFVDLVPRGCSTDPWPDRPVKYYHAAGFKVRIAPHGRAVATRAGIQLIGSPPPSPMYPHLPKGIVNIAKSTKAGYMQVQFGITAVRFEDGTAWPAQTAIVLRDDFAPTVKTLTSDQVIAQHALIHPDPFDPQLVETEVGKCADVAAAESALQSVEEVVFDREEPTASDRNDDKTSPPHLRFSCSLEGPKAICRMPMATHHITPGAPGF